ncbi:MAG TPA: CoA-binding protein [Candidatus Acidoferrales bacterium]|nr:CoA-binding protein [Candidatus Acidoferrales bacterium]
MPEGNNVVQKILGMKVVAVVGLSKDPSKPSHDVAKYLLDHGYRVIPVNPTVQEVLGQKSYPSLLELPAELKREVDVIDIFRRAEDVPPIVEEAIQLHSALGRPKAIWMQLGIVNEQAAAAARDAGMDVVMDRCMKIEHNRLS